LSRALRRVVHTDRTGHACFVHSLADGPTMSIIRSAYMGLLASLAAVTMAVAPACAQQPKPNILVIMGDDIGFWNISAYNRGMMGYRTPNIDRIASEGAIFTDYYGQQSCTAGRVQSCARWS
jgi:Sulfatase